MAALHSSIPNKSLLCSDTVKGFKAIQKKEQAQRKMFALSEPKEGYEWVKQQYLFSQTVAELVFHSKAATGKEQDWIASAEGKEKSTRSSRKAAFDKKVAEQSFSVRDFIDDEAEEARGRKKKGSEEDKEDEDE